MNASGVVTCQYPQIYLKSLSEKNYFLCFLRFYLQVYLSMYDLLSPHNMNGLTILCFYCKSINEKVGEVGISYVFSLRHHVDAIFKNNQSENSC